MSAIKNMYGKTKLSEDKKAELKAALGERYPQYAESRTYKTEGIRMNDTKINGNSGQVKVSRKWRNGAIIAAAAALILTVGMKLASEVYEKKAERINVSPAGQVEDSREGQVKEDVTTDDEYIEDADMEMRGVAKTIYNSVCEAYADLIDTLSNELVLGEEKKITAEMVRQSRETEIVHEDGKCSALEFAAAMDSNWCMDYDLTDYDFAVDFMYDESGTKIVSINYVYVYLDPEHKSFTTYPPYGSMGGVTENGITRRFSYDSSCAKKVYEETEAAIAEFTESGEYFTIDSINLTDVQNEYYRYNDGDIRENMEEDDKMRFAQALLKEGSMTMQLLKDSNNFVIKFTHDSNGNVNGVEKVYVQVFKDEADENGEHKNERYVYPDENKPNEMSITVPDVTGKEYHEAFDELELLGLFPAPREQYSNTVPEGIVISTEPEAGKESEFGRYVTINISQGPLGQKIILPDVRGKNVNEAVSELESLGFNTTIESINSGIYPKGTVADTDPEGEDESECAYERGKNVTLYVSTGKFVVQKEETEGEKTKNVQ
ncbi:PASTA domain-containing protein [uncultured Ruminococcus sp.]|uniref:PASTA domain-containing protein n=1 Tax=uncultured Ruminococcus sp. TaxID=165186 RepID=UPI0025FFB76A|nr:PASTA domain-containing protein [uncultured Ruminococcus sp.]